MHFEYVIVYNVVSDQKFWFQMHSFQNKRNIPIINRVNGELVSIKLIPDLSSRWANMSEGSMLIDTQIDRR